VEPAFKKTNISDLVDAMVAAADNSVSDKDLEDIEFPPVQPAAHAQVCSPPTQ